MLKYLFFITGIALSLNQLTAVSKSGGANFYIFDAFVIFYAFFGFFVLLISRRPVLIPKTQIPFMAFIAVALISLVAKIYAYLLTDWLLSFFYWFRLVSYVFSAIVTYNLLLQKVLTVQMLMRFIIILGVFVSLLGFMQLLVLPDFTVLSAELGWDPHQNRLSSTFFDPNFVGGFLSICVALLFAQFGIKEDPVFSRKWLYFLTFVLLFAVFLTFSRSAWVALAVVILVYGLFRYRILLLLGVLVAFLAYFAVPRVQTRISGITDPADSAAYRFASWENSIVLIEDNFLSGVGFNAYRYAQLDYGFFEVGSIGGNSGAGADSSFLFVFATTGLVGFLIFVFGYFWPIYNIPVSGTRTGDYDLAFLSVFLGLFLQSQFINALFYPQILFIWLTLLSVISFYKLR